MSTAVRGMACLTMTILLANVIWSGMGIPSDADHKYVVENRSHTSRFFFMDAATTVLWSWILVALPITRIVLMKGRSVMAMQQGGGSGASRATGPFHNPAPQTNPDNDPTSRDPHRQFQALASSTSETRVHQSQPRKPTFSRGSSNSGSSSSNSNRRFFGTCSPTGRLVLFGTLVGHALLILLPALGIAGLYSWWLIEFLAGRLGEYKAGSYLTSTPHQPGYECRHVNGEDFHHICKAEVGMALFALASVAWLFLDVIILASREWRIRQRLRKQGEEDLELPHVVSQP